jgi:hypothetical protein
MTAQSVLSALTIVGVALFGFEVGQGRAVQPDPIAPVLRAHALEIVDGQGRVRAAIRVLPADPTVKMPDGTTGYPETVLLRLIDSRGGPNVKIAATEDGSGLVLGGKSGESDPTFVQILARGSSTSLKLLNRDGRQQLIKP